MLDTPEIIQTTSQRTAFVHVVVPRAKIREVMGPGLAEVKAGLAAQGVAATGPWFTHHLRIDPAVFDYEICLPVATPVTAVGRVKPGEWPALKMARTVFHGPYEGLGAAWEEFDEWIVANGHLPGEELWERYLAGPESSPVPANWRTELSRQVDG